jgi:hypothetical protein
MIYETPVNLVFVEILRLVEFGLFDSVLPFSLERTPYRVGLEVGSLFQIVLFFPSLSHQ